MIQPTHFLKSISLFLGILFNNSWFQSQSSQASSDSWFYCYIMLDRLLLVHPLPNQLQWRKRPLCLSDSKKLVCSIQWKPLMSILTAINLFSFIYSTFSTPGAHTYWKSKCAQAHVQIHVCSHWKTTTYAFTFDQWNATYTRIFMDSHNISPYETISNHCI